MGFGDPVRQQVCCPGPQPSCPVSYRVLCETVKDFVARVGKAYEKTTESSQESEVMAKKVGPWAQGRSSSRCKRACSPCFFFSNLVLGLERETGLSPQDLG